MSLKIKKIHLSNKQVKNIRQLYIDGYSISFIARKYKMKVPSIQYRVFDLTRPIALNKNDKRIVQCKFSENEILEIRSQYINDKKSAKQIAIERKVGHSTILGIVNGRTYRWIKGKTAKCIIKPKKEKLSRRICDIPLGAKKNTKQKIKRGGLTYLMNRYNISRSTAWIWVQKEKVILPSIFIKE